MADPDDMRARAQRWRRDATDHGVDAAMVLRHAAELLEEQADVILQARAARDTPTHDAARRRG
jgi:hypothetical protein